MRRTGWRQAALGTAPIAGLLLLGMILAATAITQAPVTLAAPVPAGNEWVPAYGATGADPAERPRAPRRRSPTAAEREPYWRDEELQMLRDLRDRRSLPFAEVAAHLNERFATRRTIGGVSQRYRRLPMAREAAPRPAAAWTAEDDARLFDAVPLVDGAHVEPRPAIFAAIAQELGRSPLSVKQVGPPSLRRLHRPC
jgi:hypothetical protein